MPDVPTTSTVECPACANSVDVVDERLAEHDRQPDAPEGAAPERCRWSGEPVALIVG